LPRCNPTCSRLWTAGVVNNIVASPERLEQLVQAAISGAVQTHASQIAELATELRVTQAAALAMLRSLGHDNVPVERLPDMLVSATTQILAMREALSRPSNEGSEIGELRRQAVYALDAGGNVRRLIEGIACANSICWSPDGATLYFTDMPTRRIDAFDYDLTSGAVSNRRPFADLSTEPGFADGSVVDAEGYLWNAQWGGSKVVRYSPEGFVDREIRLPVAHPTCLTFGGSDLDVLFVTSGWFGLDEAARTKQANAGSLFALKPGVRGRLENRFAG